MKNYIIPRIQRYQNIDDLLENKNSNRSLFDTEENLSIDKLLQEDFVCIVGDPGIGKSRLVEEIVSDKIGLPLYHCNASQFDSKSVPEYAKLCIIDALDEVDGSIFFTTLQSIKDYKTNNPDVKVLFICRKHYVASYAKHFASCIGLIYVELCKLRDKDVMDVVNVCSETTKAQIAKNSKLKDLLSIPRYLTYFSKYVEQKGEISNISDLFELIIGSSIQSAISKRQDIKKNESFRILIQRVLEKMAFIMEISRKDQISKDELYTILDGVKGNMSQMLLANFDILFFESRILKDTNGILKFESTEIQEYLASKELCRQDNVESVLYDVAVQKELKHIYPNWYDVIPHISYTEDRIYSFINVIKFILSYESNLENNSFESLLRYVDSSILTLQQREELFSIILDHYLRVPSYIGWNSKILKLMSECYSSKSNARLTLPVEQLGKIQLANISEILKAIIENGKLDKDVSVYWTTAANTLMQTDNKDNQLAALKLYSALKNEAELICLSEKCNGFDENVKDKYYEVTGYGKFTDKTIVDCWLKGCFERNPYAIDAILCIEDPFTLTYVYTEIIKANQLYDFFNPKGDLFVYYESYLKKQFQIAWNEDSEAKVLVTKVIAAFVDNQSHTTDNEFNAIIRQILLEEKTGSVFISCFEESKWDLENLFIHFNPEIVDAELIMALDKLLQESKTEKWLSNFILTSLVNKIRKDEAKKASVSDYISRYAETFDQWHKNSEEEEKRRLNNPTRIKAYQSLSDSDIPDYIKYDTAYKLSKDIDFLRQQNPKPIRDVFDKFFANIDLDETTIKKKDNNSFNISTFLTAIPYFVKAMFHLGFHDLLKKHRIVLAKTLPLICLNSNMDSSEIKKIYKSVIGNIDEKEKTELIEWWKSRKDDLMNISSDSIFVCITDYDIEALSYKLEEYIEEYIENQDLDHKLAALKSLELIANGYLDWCIEKYRILFNTLKDDNIESIKMLCNAIMIEKFQDLESITWRIDYLKKHPLKSLQSNTGHAHAISLAESEMISPNPQMFRCFMNIKGSEKLNEQMAGLFDVGLSLCDKPDMQEYSSYLLKQIYLFFVTTDNGYYFSELRKKVEKSDATKNSILVGNIMTNAEMLFIKKEKVSIDKAIKQYNKCIEESHLEIRNDSDLRRYFTQIHSEVQKEIQDQGIYSLVRQELLSEDFIQRELKNTIINKCCQMGLEAVQIDREVTLQDNKRTDFLIRYGLCNPIMVELKLLNNNEIQDESKRHEYRKKFIQYTNATHACLSVFLVFDVHKNGSDATKFEKLREEYKDVENTLVLLTDCKCSSGLDTGVNKDKSNSNLNKNTNGERNGKKRFGKIRNAYK